MPNIRALPTPTALPATPTAAPSRTTARLSDADLALLLKKPPAAAPEPDLPRERINQGDLDKLFEVGQ